MSKSTVAARRVRPAHVLEDIAALCEQAGLADGLARRAPTILRDQRLCFRPHPAANTTPWQLEGMVLALHDHGVRELTCVQPALAAASPTHPERDPTRLTALYDRYEVRVKHTERAEDMRWVEHRPRAKLRVLDRLFPDGVRVPDFYEGTNVVHLPTVRCDAEAVTAGAVMNTLEGLLPSKRTPLRSLLSRALVDALAIQRELHASVFALADATTAGDGPGPRAMVAVTQGVMLASRDPVALDAVCAKLMGFDPLSIEYLRLAHDDRLGTAAPRDIALVGDDLSRENWGFSSQRDSGPLSRVLPKPWPLRRLERALAKTPVGAAYVLGEELFREHVRWHIEDRGAFERWRRETPWGQLFARYEREGSIAPPPKPPVPSVPPGHGDGPARG